MFPTNIKHKEPFSTSIIKYFYYSDRLLEVALANTNKGKYAPYRERIAWWTNPWIIVSVIVMMLIGLPMILWILTYKSYAGATMFAITWISLMGFVVWIVKRNLLDARYYIQEKTLDETRLEINADRKQVRKELLSNEIEVLARGQKTPVLDVWRLDHKLAARHPYFSSAQLVTIDPSIRELYIRIQIGEIQSTDESRIHFQKIIWHHLVRYLKIVAGDSYLALLIKFFDKLVLQIDSVREDSRHIDVPYPVLSCIVDSRVLRTIQALPTITQEQFLKLADVRFSGGGEIEPHRLIE